MKFSRRDLLKIGAAATAATSMHALPVSGATDIVSSSASPCDAEIKSCCPFCQVRCTTLVQVKDGRVVNVYGNPDNYWTEGGMCPKGQSLVELTYSPHRLLHPLLRDGDKWKQISYQDAVELVAQKILQVKSDFPDDYAHKVVMFAPLWESRESELTTIMAMKLAGFPDIYHPGDTCIGNSGTALRVCLGSGITPTTLDEITHADLVVLWGCNIAETYPLYIRWIDKARARGVKILYIDPRRTPTSNHCDEQIVMRPGTDGVLALGLIRLLIEGKRFDAQYVEKHVLGFKELAESSQSYTPEKAAAICRIPVETIRNLAEQYGSGKKTVVWLGASISKYTNSIQSVRAIIALQAITGNLAGAGRGIMQVQGGKPGGSEAFEEHFRAPDLGVALNFRKSIFNMERDRVRVLLLNASYRRYSDVNRLRKAIAKVDFVVYRGFFMDEEAQSAHLIIPASMVFECAGSQYGNQRQVVWKEKAIESLGETVSDWRFYNDLGRKILKDRFPVFEKEEDTYELFRQYAPTWGGITLERLKQDPSGIQWPCPSVDHPGGGGSLYPDNIFATSHGKVELNTAVLDPIQWSEPEGSPESDVETGRKFPLILLQGKVVHHWQHTLTNWSAYMAQFSESNFVQVHPDTVRALGIKDGDWVSLETEGGKIKARAKINDLIMPGVVWTPSHPAPTSPFDGNRGECINAIIPPRWDMVGAQFNGFGCRLTRI
jgi:formate dehydrogenase (coenzyme F420) alpha subunit